MADMTKFYSYVTINFELDKSWYIDYWKNSFVVPNGKEYPEIDVFLQIFYVDFHACKK